MSTVNKKWSTLFPKSIGNETRSDKPIDNTQAYETDGFPKFMSNDPVRYDLQNAVMTQAMSNDERLNEKINNIANTYVKKSGDTMTGALNLANHTWNLAGNDAYFGDANKSGCFCIKGANNDTGLTLINRNDNTDADCAIIRYSGKNIVVNKSIDGNITGTATAATNDSDGNAINTTYLKKADFPKNISAFDNDAKYLQTADLLDKVYPVGSIYLSMVNTDPKNLFGGTWQRISQGRMLLGADDSTYKVGATGGTATETLTVNQIPGHTHTGITGWADLQGTIGGWDVQGNKVVAGAFTIESYGNYNNTGGSLHSDYPQKFHMNVSHNHTFSTNSIGGGQAHNNMSPYLSVYIWQRIA